MIRFRIFGFEISVTFGFLLVMSLLSLKGFGFMATASCIIHELGHCFASVILNVKIKSLTLWAGGIQMERESRLISSGNELAILICGPLFNLIFAAVYSLTGMPDAAGINFVLAVFNLLPYSSVDGGSIIKVISDSKYAVIQKVTAVSAGIIILLFFYLTGTGNITAFATIILLTVNELLS